MYEKIGWEDSPSTKTPILAVSLNQMDNGIERANKGIVFSYSATFTADGVVKTTTELSSLVAGDFATSQTDIVTVFVASNVTTINNGTFTNCTSLKTIYIDNTVNNISIASGAIPDGVSVIYCNDDDFININDLLANAIKSLKTKIVTDEEQHKADVQALTDKANQLETQATKDRENFTSQLGTTNESVKEKESLSNKVDIITHPSTTTYPSVKGVWDFVETKSEQPLADIEQNKTDIAQLNADVLQNAIKVTTDKATSTVLQDSSSFNIVGLTLYGKSTQSAEPSPDSPVSVDSIHNPSITLTDDTNSQEITMQYTLKGIDELTDTLTINSDGTGFITEKFFYEKLTSGESYSNRNWQYSTSSGRFYRDDSRIKNKVGTPNLMCSHFIAKDNERDLTLNNTIGFTSGNAAAHGIAIRMSELNGDVSAFKRWLDNNDVYILAPLVEPVVRELSKTEVEKILNLHTYYPSTTIKSDCDCQLTYIADTKNYIDNKLNEIATALVAHESEVI